MEDDESNESDEAFFARVHAFHAAHAPFADVVAQAVGVVGWNVGEWPTAAPKEGCPLVNTVRRRPYSM